MLFRGCQNKDRMTGRLFQCFQKGIEGCLRQHVNLIDDIDTVFADLWGNPHLVGQVSYIVYRVVRGGIQFMDIVGTASVESLA